MTNLEKAGEISTLGANRAGDFEENFHWLTRALLKSTRDFQDKVFIDVILLKELSLKWVLLHILNYTLCPTSFVAFFGFFNHLIFIKEAFLS